MARVLPITGKTVLAGLIISLIVVFVGKRQIDQVTPTDLLGGLVIFTVVVNEVLKRLSPPRKYCSSCGRRHK